jgi:hypothetical protein
MFVLPVPGVGNHDLGLVEGPERGVAVRCEVVGGDFFESTLPSGDVYLMSHSREMVAVATRPGLAFAASLPRFGEMRDGRPLRCPDLHSCRRMYAEPAWSS